MFMSLQRLVQALSLVASVAGNLSALGTFSAPTLPRFISGPVSPSSVFSLEVRTSDKAVQRAADNVSQAGCPWGNATAHQVNPEDIPNTGVTRRYTFTVARGTLAPDGVSRPVILVNGQFPGPAIQANWGDWIEVTLHNQILEPGEGAAIHFHGIRQRGTPWFDGVPSTSQCPIPPGSSFTYRFQADAWGTSFWHSHFGAQYSAGVFGPIIIHG